MKFTHNNDDVYGNQIESITVELHQHATLDELLETFTRFVRACGYHFEGDIDIVNNEIYYESTSEDQSFDNTDYEQYQDQFESNHEWPFPVSTKP